MTHAELRSRYLHRIDAAIKPPPTNEAEQDALIEALSLHAATCVLAQARAGYSAEIVQLMAEAGISAMDKVLASKDTN